MNKRELSERDICSKYITPALTDAGWDLHNQMREEVTLTDGKIQVRGQMTTRGKKKRADYILYYKSNIPIAVIEAKDNKHTVGDGMQQALHYAEILDVPFAFSSNGDAFLFHDMTDQTAIIESEIELDEFISPDELWQRYCEWKGITREELQSTFTQDYYIDQSGKSPRYYQTTAINRSVEAIAKGQDRILLVMATGTGKTYTAFQIIWRMWKAKKKKRILFLADRNILIDQTIVNDFKPFGGAMTKVKKRQVDKSYEIYLALYQAISGPEDWQNIYKQFTEDFFDLIVIDECHRGSASEASAWHEILRYFNSATHIGLTATPKETNDISNLAYFGKPVYTYSLKQGIEDGFLAPYKVVRIDLDKDLEGWRPEEGKKDKYGVEIEDRIYNQSDFDRELILEQRTEVVAKKVTEYLEATDPFGKTIVFCEDIPHAERMRQALTNANPSRAKERRYIMRMTGDNEEGKAELDNFIDPESRYPVIVTTSKLLTTGVDAQTCKVIVLDKIIKSITEFKQIIGRGTRVREDYGKMFFTIMDFKKATELFADPDFDGEPVTIYEPGPDDPVEPHIGEPPGGDDGEDPIPPEPPEPGEPRFRYYVNDVPVSVVAERVQYYGKEGRLITEDLKDYTKETILGEYSSLEHFLTKWNESDRKATIINELKEEGLFIEALEEEVGKEYDVFDIICHLAFDQPPLTRRERVENVRKNNYFTKYGEKARAVIEALLDKYSDQGISNIEDIDIIRVNPFTEMGTPMEIIKSFGGRDEYLKAVREIETALYAA